MYDCTVYTVAKVCCSLIIIIFTCDVPVELDSMGQGAVAILHDEVVDAEALAEQRVVRQVLDVGQVCLRVVVSLPLGHASGGKRLGLPLDGAAGQGQLGEGVGAQGAPLQ